jgi:hypothetical protein
VMVGDGDVWLTGLTYIALGAAADRACIVA